MSKTLLRAAAATGLVFTLASGSASAVLIDNDIAPGVLGHFNFDTFDGVSELGGGESRDADITASRLASADLFTENLLFDYFSYVDPGNNGDGFRLSTVTTAGPTLIDLGAGIGSDAVTSSGSFAGVNGIIDWTVTSSIPDGGSLLTSVFDFTAAPTTILGELRFYQYLDEDIEAVGDDVFFTRGTAAGGDLELFTVDNTRSMASVMAGLSREHMGS